MNELTGRILHSAEKQATELCEQLEWEQLKTIETIRDNIRHILSTEFIETTIEVEEKDFINNMFKEWEKQENN